MVIIIKNRWKKPGQVVPQRLGIVKQLPPCPAHYLTVLPKVIHAGVPPGLGDISEVHELLTGNVNNSWLYSVLTWISNQFFAHIVTMNRTSELRAALHRPVSVSKRSGGKSDSISGKSPRKSYRAANSASITRDSKSKRRPRKKASQMDSAVNKNPTEMAKALLANDPNENEREQQHGFRF